MRSVTLSGIERKARCLTASLAKRSSTLLRSGGDLTLSRFLGALDWFTANWPADAEMPQALMDYVSGSVASVGNHRPCLRKGSKSRHPPVPRPRLIAS